MNYVIDDAFITFRYARNLVQGDGLVYNPGERVEGYTNFLWTVMLAGANWLLPAANLLTIAQTLGILFGILTLLMVYLFSRTICQRDGPFGLLAVAFLTFNSSFVAWSTAGLETNLFSFLVFAGAFAYVRYLQDGRGFLLAPAIFAMAALTRPDGVLFFGLTSLHALILHLRHDAKTGFRRMVLWTLTFSAIFVPYYVWRFSYYGYPFPNTFYAKVGSGVQQYIRGARYLVSYCLTYGAFVFIPIAILFVRRRRTPWQDYFAVLLGGHSAYVCYVGGDGLGFHRFIAYVAPLFYLLVQEGYWMLYERLKTALPNWKLAWPAMVVILLSLGYTTRATALPLFFPTSCAYYNEQSRITFPIRGTENDYDWFDNYFVDRLAVAARWLEREAPSTAVVASTPAGAIGYYMRHNVIDMLGLNDEHIAHSKITTSGSGRAGHEKGDGAYVLSRMPDYVLMGNVAVLPFPLDRNSMAKALVLRSEHELWNNPEFHRQYDLVCIKLAEKGLFQYFTFFKRRTADAMGSAERQAN